jgi:hypothetical protein
MGELGGPTPADPGLVERRFESILEVARLHGTSVGVEDLAALLPAAGPRDASEVSRWLEAHPTVGELSGESAVRPGAAPSLVSIEERRARGLEYRRQAETLLRSTFAPVAPLVRCVGITGSAAYLEPQEGDDLDLMVVTRAGALWFFLGYTYLAQRLGRDPGPVRIRTCMNYALDDVEAREEFARPRGFLFAREALTMRPVGDATYYRALLGSAPWLGTELPRMFARWAPKVSHVAPQPKPAPPTIRLLNFMAYPLVAAYLQLAGLVRNRRARRSGRPEQAFRTQSSWHRLAFQSVRFDRLDALYADSSASPSSQSGVRA